jgi:tRNA-2-methylthio-N6-dimethylallyladenosine synthase
VIVGFPGESREDFAATLALVERMGFSGLFGFMYSQRPYTAAQNLADDVPEAEKSARLAELFRLSGSSIATSRSARRAARRPRFWWSNAATGSISVSCARITRASRT